MDDGDGNKSSPPAADQQAGVDPNFIDPTDMAEEEQRKIDEEVDRRVAAAMAERGLKENVTAAVLERLADSIAAACRRDSNESNPTGMVEMRRQRLEIPDFNPDGLNDEGEVVAAFQVFQTSMKEYCGHNDLWDVLNGIKVPVGNSNISMETLNSNFRPEAVKKSLSLWNLLLSRIKGKTAWQRVHSTSSPQEGWEVLVSMFTVRQEEAKRRFDREFRQLEQKVGEGVMQYLSRAETARRNLENVGVMIDETEGSRAIIRGLRDDVPDLRLQKLAMLTNTGTLSRGKLDELMRQVVENERNATRGGENDDTRHALLAADAGRSGRDGHPRRQQAAQGPPAGGAERIPPQHYCDFHGYNKNHDSKYCMQLYRLFALRHSGEFDSYLEKRRHFLGDEQPRRQQGSGGRRAQQYPTGQGGGSWSQSRPSMGPSNRGRGFSGGGRFGRQPGGLAQQQQQVEMEEQPQGEQHMGDGFGRGLVVGASDGGVGRGGASGNSPAGVGISSDAFASAMDIDPFNIWAAQQEQQELVRQLETSTSDPSASSSSPSNGASDDRFPRLRSCVAIHRAHGRRANFRSGELPPAGEPNLIVGVDMSGPYASDNAAGGGEVRHLQLLLRRRPVSPAECLYPRRRRDSPSSWSARRRLRRAAQSLRRLQQQKQQHQQPSAPPAPAESSTPSPLQPAAVDTSLPRAPSPSDEETLRLLARVVRSTISTRGLVEGGVDSDAAFGGGGD